MQDDKSLNQLLKPALFFFKDKETRTYLAVFAIAFLLLTLKTYYSLAIRDSELHDEVRFIDTWSISFNESSESVDETFLLGNDEVEIITLEFAEADIPDGYAIGMFLVHISYEETNQAIGGDPCDTVQATIGVTSLNAQWEDDYNSLSNSSNSCDTFTLQLLSYPNYDGSGYEIEAHNKVIALEPWSSNQYGIGSLEIEIKLQVEQSQVPTQNTDDDEMITVVIETVYFSTSAEKLS